MAVFLYEAQTKQGAVQQGKVEAHDEAAAIEVIQSHDLTILSLKPASSVSIINREISFFRRVSSKDLAAFSRQLSVLFQSDVPIVESLRALGAQTTSDYLKEALSAIVAGVDGGTTLSDALEKYPDIFSNFYVQMVRAGEASGKLDEVLNYLAEHTEQSHETNSKIKGAMAYPAFVLSAFVLIGAGMMIFVVPQLTSVLTQSEAELPFFTQVIVGISDFLRRFWYFLAGALALGLLAFWQFLKTEEGIRFWDELQLQMPIVGTIVRNVYVFRFTESLAMLIRGGVPITQALTISGDIVGNSVYRSIIHEARDRVVQGEAIAPVLDSYEEIPKLVTQMISVGEQTGKIEVLLENVSEFYQREVNTTIASITSLIEPVLIVVLGLGVLALVLGILMPIYNTVNTF